MRSQRGLSLIEVLLALALVGILGATIPSALSTANRATIISNKHAMAESLACSQIDFIQNQPYDKTNNPPSYIVLSDLPTGYNILTPMAARLDPRSDGTENDDGLQKITVNVTFGEKTVYTLTDYKVDFNP